MNNLREHLRCSRRGCSYTTNRAYNLGRHERNHDKGKVPISQCQPCPHCTYAAGSLHNLMRHISKKHSCIVKSKIQVLTGNQSKQPCELPTAKKSNPGPEQKLPSDPAFDSPADASLWYWSSPQQQEKNFLKRSGLKSECRILERSVNLFKLYALVKSRGGALDVDDWDDVAAALNLPPGSGCNVGVKYMEVLFEFEKKEGDRLQECQNSPGVPSWWDDGDFLIDDVDCVQEYNESSRQCSNNLYHNSHNVQNAIIKLIYDRYYRKHLGTSKPFQRFSVKDSWLQATMLTYRELSCQLHFRHRSNS